MNDPYGCANPSCEFCNPKEKTMEYEVAQDKQYPQSWRVEAIDSKEGDCFVTVFDGPDAEARAREYANFKNN